MSSPLVGGSGPLAAAGRVLRRLVALGGNRAELLLVELAEERARAVQVAGLALGAAVLALLAGMTLTALLVWRLWPVSPSLALALPALLHLVGAAVLGLRVRRLCSGAALLPATLEQVRRDLAALEGCLPPAPRREPSGSAA
jgi:uncharacterized membrane protein YqjE